jgi:Thioredoxin reductase
MTTDRRRFLQGMAAGVTLGATSLKIQPAAAATHSGFVPPNLLKGEVIRTSGQLTNHGSLLEAPREIPVAGHCDVLVVGAGPAGIGAAIAAARAGMKTRLIETAGCLGGVWTAGLLTKILDAGNKTGIIQEVLTALAVRGSGVAKATDGTVYDPELCKLILEEMCGEANVYVQLHTQLVGAITDSRNRIVAIVTESKSGRQAWTASRFIDCSGDGDLAAQAGCQFDVGIGTTCECQPMSMMALVAGLDPNDEALQPFIRENGPEAKPRFLKLMREAGINPSYRSPTLRHLHSGIFSIMTNHEYGVPATDAARVTEATIASRAEVHEIVNGLRRLGGPWKDMAVVTTAEQIGVREGRRIKGRYEITAQSIVEGLTHPDAVCRARFGFDVHHVRLDELIPSEAKITIPGRAKPYDIPLPALIAADVDGLMMAGRCISGDFIAHSSYRVTGNAVPMGEAAGRTCAASIIRDVMPHELSWEQVQQICPSTSKAASGVSNSESDLKD